MKRRRLLDALTEVETAARRVQRAAAEARAIIAEEEKEQTQGAVTVRPPTPIEPMLSSPSAPSNVIREANKTGPRMPFELPIEFSLDEVPEPASPKVMIPDDRPTKPSIGSKRKP